MKALLWTVVAAVLHVALATGVSADEKSVRTESKVLIKSERAGVRYYKKGNYEKAYEMLRPPALSGFKQAQYLMGIMCLKGQSVPQTLVTGMGWLGVADEAGIPDWTRTFDEIYQKASPTQKQAIDQKVKEFIDLYGLEAQQMTCSKHVKLGSRRTEIVCNKRLGTGSPMMELENPAASPLE